MVEGRSHLERFKRAMEALTSVIRIPDHFEIVDPGRGGYVSRRCESLVYPGECEGCRAPVGSLHNPGCSHDVYQRRNADGDR